jgi:hypothetical protein
MYKRIFPFPQAPPRLGELGGLLAMGGVLVGSGDGSVAETFRSGLSNGGSSRAPCGGTTVVRGDVPQADCSVWRRCLLRWGAGSLRGGVGSLHGGSAACPGLARWAT